MSDVTSTFNSLSSTESSNSPSGATVIGSGLDDNLRMIQSLLAAWRDQSGWGGLTLTSVAGTNTITATLATAGSVTFGPTALAAGMRFVFTPANSNTGATTLNITSPNGGSALGAKNIYWNGSACVGGELFANVPVVVQYDGTQFNIIGTSGATRIPPWAIAGGTADAITAGYTPANTSLVDGMLLAFRAGAANTTTAPTFSPDGLTAHPITKLGGFALTAGDITNSTAEYLLRYNSANTRWELLNPSSSQSTYATTFTFDGAGGTSGSITISYHRVGEVVTLRIPSVLTTSGTGSTVLTANTAAPASIRPAAQQDLPCNVIEDNATPTGNAGIIRITSAGVISIFKNIAASAFTNSATAGTATITTVTYLLV